MDSLCICGDSYADVSSKSLFTDISGLSFLNFLPVTIRIYLNNKFIGVVPKFSSIYFNNGFDLYDRLTFFAVTGTLLGTYIIKDQFVRRIQVGTKC